MDFDETPEDAAFRAEVRAWLDGVATRRSQAAQPLAILDEANYSQAEIERARRWQRAAMGAGWAAITWPPEYGGRGASLGQALILAEEKAGYDVPSAIFEIGINILGPAILAHGTDEQKHRYLPPLLSGDEIWCQLWSEPGAGSDLASLAARADLDAMTGDWCLNGQKVWTSGAHYADFGLGIFRSDARRSKHEGISCLIVDMRSPGITVRPLRQITGGAHFNEVFFDDTPVPANSVVGEVHGGWRVAKTTLMFERMATGAMVPPSHAFPALAGLDALADGLMRQRLADVYARSRAADLTMARVRTQLSHGRLPGPEGSILKLALADIISAQAELGVDLLGLGGTLSGSTAPEGGRWPRALLASPAVHIGGGTDEIQKNIVGERVLGLPREPDVNSR